MPGPKKKKTKETIRLENRRAHNLLRQQQQALSKTECNQKDQLCSYLDVILGIKVPDPDTLQKDQTKLVKWFNHKGRHVASPRDVHPSHIGNSLQNRNLCVRVRHVSCQPEGERSFLAVDHRSLLDIVLTYRCLTRQWINGFVLQHIATQFSIDLLFTGRMKQQISSIVGKLKRKIDKRDLKSTIRLVQENHHWTFNVLESDIWKDVHNCSNKDAALTQASTSGAPGDEAPGSEASGSEALAMVVLCKDSNTKGSISTSTCSPGRILCKEKRRNLDSAASSGDTDNTRDNDTQHKKTKMKLHVKLSTVQNCLEKHFHLRADSPELNVIVYNAIRQDEEVFLEYTPRLKALLFGLITHVKSEMELETGSFGKLHDHFEHTYAKDCKNAPGISQVDNTGKDFTTTYRIPMEKSSVIIDISYRTALEIVKQNPGSPPEIRNFLLFHAICQEKSVKLKYTYSLKRQINGFMSRLHSQLTFSNLTKLSGLTSRSFQCRVYFSDFKDQRQFVQLYKETQDAATSTTKNSSGNSKATKSLLGDQTKDGDKNAAVHKITHSVVTNTESSMHVPARDTGSRLPQMKSSSTKEDLVMSKSVTSTTKTSMHIPVRKSNSCFKCKYCYQYFGSMSYIKKHVHRHEQKYRRHWKVSSIVRQNGHKGGSKHGGFSDLQAANISKTIENTATDRVLSVRRSVIYHLSCFLCKYCSRYLGDAHRLQRHVRRHEKRYKGFWKVATNYRKKCSDLDDRAMHMTSTESIGVQAATKDTVDPTSASVNSINMTTNNFCSAPAPDGRNTNLGRGTADQRIVYDFKSGKTVPSINQMIESTKSSVIIDISYRTALEVVKQIPGFPSEVRNQLLFHAICQEKSLKLKYTDSLKRQINGFMSKLRSQLTFSNLTKLRGLTSRCFQCRVYSSDFKDQRQFEQLYKETQDAATSTTISKSSILHL